MENCDLSIITVTYNNPNIDRTLESVLLQNPMNFSFEHIIVDNVSDDDTEEVVNDYIKKAPYKVIYIREKDKGIYNAMNKGIKISKGKYLSFMNAGDKFYDNNSLKNILNHTNNTDIIFGNLNVIREDNRESVYIPPDNINLKYFLDSALPNQASIIRKDIFSRVGYYDESIMISSDWKLFILAIVKLGCSYKHINKTIASYYLGGISSKEENKPKIETEKINIINEEFSEIKKINFTSKDKKESFNTPILFLVFNRLDTAKEVFKQIKKIKPTKFYIASDGARENKKEESKIVKEIRDFILKNIDWECEVNTLFRIKNLGCGRSVSSAITWFFNNVEEGIILEDDCFPDESFFEYCQKLLDKYRYDNRISHINGTSFVKNNTMSDSYYYSRYFHVWGWATWKRAWINYDFYMKNYKEFRDSNYIKNLFHDTQVQNFWISCFDQIYFEKKDTWDYQWVYMNFINNQLSIMPFFNLIKNIGFGEKATHTLNSNDKSANRDIEKIGSIKDPLFIMNNIILDQIIYEDHLGIFFNKSNINTNEKRRVINAFSLMKNSPKIFIKRVLSIAKEKIKNLYRESPPFVKKIYRFIKYKII